MAADQTAEATNRGFASLTAFLRQDNSRDSQERRTSQKMMQAGDSQITMWVRRTAVSVENIERMFKSFLVDAEVRQNKMMEALLEAARGGKGRGDGGGGKADQAGDDPKFDWKKNMKSKWFAPIMVGLLAWIKDIFSSPAWGEKLGLEAFSTKIGVLFGGSRGGGWFNMLVNAGKWAVLGGALGVKGGFLGVLAGAILGAIFGAVTGWFGAEKVAKLIDPIVKGFMRIFGLSTATTDKNLAEAKIQYSKAEAVAKNKKKALAALDAQIAKEEDPEIRAKLMEKRLKLSKQHVEAEEALRVAKIKEGEISKDLLRNKRNALQEELKTLQMAEVAYIAFKDSDRKKLEMMRKKGETDTDEYKNLKIEADLRDMEAKTRQDRLKLLEGPDGLVADSKKALQAMEKSVRANTDPKFFGPNIVGGDKDQMTETALRDLKAFLGKIADDLKSLTSGRDLTSSLESFKSWEKHRKVLQTQREVQMKVFKASEEKLDGLVNKTIDGLIKSNKITEDQREEYAKRMKASLMSSGTVKGNIPMPEEVGRGTEGMLRDASSYTRRHKQKVEHYDKRLNVGEKLKSLFKQHNTYLKSTGQEEITKEEFTKQFDELQERWKKIAAENVFKPGAVDARPGVIDEAAATGAEVPNLTNIVTKGGDTTTLTKGGNGGNGKQAQVFPASTIAVSQAQYPW